ncbi:MAG: glycosyl hydrolase family 18 protein [Melioribacteraceae bacterium]|nr:glycosyl hydrolase family 18 protein [Melioribacteraceae bacterium]
MTSISLAQSLHQAENNFYKKLSEKESKNFGALADNSLTKSNSTSKLNKAVFGFLPWWEYVEGFHQHIHYDLLSHISLFSFEGDSEGNLKNPPEWPWNDLITTAHSHGLKVIMTVTNFDGNDIHRILNEPEVTNRLFQNILNTIVLHNFDGVNIDFENLLDQDIKIVLVDFLKSLKSHLSVINKPLEVSFASPSYGFGKWDFKLLADNTDYLFIMNYDYWGRWSESTGPSAPLTGNYFSVIKSIEDEYNDVPPDKIILGVPYYGNFWKSNSPNPYAPVIPFSSDSTENNWQKIVAYREIVSDYIQYEKIWDVVSQTPWIRWNDNGWNQVWYDDSLSLDLKYDFAIQKNLKGIGIWALGYDGNRSELWSLIDKKFVNPSSVETGNQLPEEFVLHQNHPNPFNPETVISFKLGVAAYVNLRIYDFLGREITTLVNEFKPDGKYSVQLSTNDFQLSTGVYFYKLTVNGNSLVKKMLLLK